MEEFEEEETWLEKATKLSLGGKIVLLVFILFLFAGFLCFEGLILWGVGNMVISVFGISYTWSFLKGLTTAVLITTLSLTTVRITFKD